MLPFNPVAAVVVKKANIVCLSTLSYPCLSGVRHPVGSLSSGTWMGDCLSADR